LRSHLASRRKTDRQAGRQTDRQTDRDKQSVTKVTIGQISVDL